MTSNSFRNVQTINRFLRSMNPLVLKEDNASSDDINWF